MNTLEFRDRLARRTRRAKAHISLAILDPLEEYYRLLAQWNAKMNLTALPLDPPTDETFDRLLVEPLVAARQIPSDRALDWLDLGSGGGSPAIPIKIARPMLRLTMVESKERKGAFLREAVRVLGLAHAAVVTDRFESIAADASFSGKIDLVTVRAIRLDSDLFDTVRQLLKSGGRLLLFRPAHSPTADPPGFHRTSTLPLLNQPPSFLTIYERSTWNNK